MFKNLFIDQCLIKSTTIIFSLAIIGPWLPITFLRLNAKSSKTTKYFQAN